MERGSCRDDDTLPYLHQEYAEEELTGDMEEQEGTEFGGKQVVDAMDATEHKKNDLDAGFAVACTLSKLAKESSLKLQDLELV